MKENNKKSLVLIIITISVFVVAIIGATYAYFATSINIDANIGVNIETAGTSYTFTASSDDSIDMSITASDMSEANVSTKKIKTGTGNIDVSLASPSDDILTTCTYDIIWVWDSMDKYTTPDVNKLPYSQSTEITEVQYEDANYECTNKDDKYLGADTYAYYCINVYNYEFSYKVDGVNETDLSDLEAGTTANSIVLKKGATISSNSTTAIEQTHVIESNIYNLPVHQTNLYDKKFKAHITIENVNCTMTDASNDKSLAAYITNDVYNSSSNQDSIVAGGVGVYKHDLSLENGAGDNSYRYAGRYVFPKATEDNYNSVDSIVTYHDYWDDDTDEYEFWYYLTYDTNETHYNTYDDALNKAIEDGYIKENVNNYVCFIGDDCSNENNLYRIISVKDNKVKVIKASSIGKMQWNTVPEDYDGSYDINIWSGSSLETYLNGEYLNSLGNKVELIDDTIWSVGGSNSNVNFNAKTFMTYELDNSVTLNKKIGLMYVSDYGFATLPKYWTNSVYNGNGVNDWLTIADNYQWTITRANRSAVVAVYPGGRSCEDSGYVRRTNEVRPTFYLKASAKILNATSEGVGSKTNPMIII